jgi:hypothetical protein
MNRSDFAINLASGLAGWHQLQVVQHLGDLSGEDTARSLVAQIINAQGQFAPATSQLPPNWGDTKKRVDVALLGRSTGAVIWYGAIEIKWPGAAFDPHQVRETIVQDAMRLAFVNTNGVNAKFLVVGGNSASISKLFDTQHPNAPDRESRRVAFGELLSRDLAHPDRHLSHGRWSAQFPKAGERVPQTTFNGFDGRLKTKLLARTNATVGGTTVGTVFIWQCNRTRGTATQPGGQPDAAP